MNHRSGSTNRKTVSQPHKATQIHWDRRSIHDPLIDFEDECILEDKELFSLATQEGDFSPQTNLSDEEWQDLYPLHESLLDKYYDYFLTSQNPWTSHASSTRAAEQITQAAGQRMAARVWHHGIHTFLEVLRLWLPESLEHMLAFIYTAFSMVTLLYETAPRFEHIWGEYLGDLARYGMAIHDSLPDQVMWREVAHSWYTKAADKCPTAGHLYHHLGTISRSFTLQQLSLYTRSLTSVKPFQNARYSILQCFSSMRNGKKSDHIQPSLFAATFIKAHEILFTGESFEDFDANVAWLTNKSILDEYIDMTAARFKEQGIYAAIANVAALFEDAEEDAKAVGIDVNTKTVALEKTQARLAFCQHTTSFGGYSIQSPVDSARSSLTTQTTIEPKPSVAFLTMASKLAFSTLSVCLRRINDSNVLPLVNVYLLFLRDLAQIEGAVAYVENDIPWNQICVFLNELAKPGAMTPRVRSVHFPDTENSLGRPLPEDFVMRGQWYFPESRISTDTAIDYNERVLELPSMDAARVERILWSGFCLASVNRWIRFNNLTEKFSSYETHSTDSRDEDSVILDVNNVSKKDASSILSDVKGVSKEDLSIIMDIKDISEDDASSSDSMTTSSSSLTDNC
ncbi:hypothetical protein MMC07_002837 [Pseudocyphellaria aurata]|nr:hypothetical protein [Pseudocyphellaria aurata]